MGEKLTMNYYFFVTLYIGLKEGFNEHFGISSVTIFKLNPLTKPGKNKMKQ